MYVHVGGEVSVPAGSITAIVNLETVLASQNRMNAFIESEENNNRLQYLNEELPKSLVVTTDRTYVSSISTSVLLKRLQEFEM